MMQALRWFWYLVRLAIYETLAFLRTINRGTSRVVFLLLILVGAYLLRAPLHDLIRQQLRQLDPGYVPETILLDVCLVILALAACVVYAVASALMIGFVSIFRVGMRPMPPARRLKATKTEISNAVVKIVVPPLPRPRRS